MLGILEDNLSTNIDNISCNPFCMNLIPKIFAHNTFVLPLFQNIVISIHKMIFALCTFYFFSGTATVGNFTAVNRIIKNQTDKMTTPSIQLSVLTWYFPDPLKIQVFRDSTVTDVRVSKHVINNPNSFCLGFFTIIKLIIF